MRGIFLLIGFLNVVSALKDVKFNSNTYYSVKCDSYNSCSLIEGQNLSGSHAYGVFNDDIEKDGWGKLWVHGDSTTQGWYESGFLEGALTSLRIYQHYQSWYAHQFPNPPTAETQQFMLDQYEFAKNLAESNAGDPYYDRAGQVLAQFEGVLAGLNYAAKQGESLSKLELLLLEASGDLYDIIPATTPSQFKLKIGQLSAEQFADEWHKVVSCSGMVKISDDLSDVFVGHTTWTSYTAMLRIYKNYNLDNGNYQVSFSAKPGVIYSKDDFYVLPKETQQLAVLETTNGILNADLYKLISPKTLLTWQRMPIANSMATSGQQWTEVFGRYQSGTYCNQYMIVDMKRFIPGQGAQSDFLWITEVIPGSNPSADVTDVVKYNGNVWPSYNVPFFKSIYIVSGYQAAFETYGNAYSYDNCTRALMMRRDHHNVQSLEAMGAEMRQNNYKTDTYSANDPSNAISPRKDLKTSSSSAFGGIDSKITSYQRLVTLANKRRQAGQQKVDSNTLTYGTSMAQCGPTHINAYLPPFSWSTSNSTELHLGQPDTFDFDFVDMDFYKY